MVNAIGDITKSYEETSGRETKLVVRVAARGFFYLKICTIFWRHFHHHRPNFNSVVSDTKSCILICANHLDSKSSCMNCIQHHSLLALVSRLPFETIIENYLIEIISTQIDSKISFDSKIFFWVSVIRTDLLQQPMVHSTHQKWGWMTSKNFFISKLVFVCKIICDRHSDKFFENP